MSGPPANVAPNDLWAQLIALPRPVRTVDYPRFFPGTETPIGQVQIHVLTQQEQNECAVSAEKYSRKHLQDAPTDGKGYDDLYKNAAAVEVLYRAVRKMPESGDAFTHPFFPSPAEIRNRLTPDEVGVLFAMYLEVQSEVGPIVSKMSEPEFEAWIARLQEGGSSFPLALLSWEMRSELTMRLVSRLCALRTATSSAGSPPEEAASSDSSEAAEASA